MTVNHSESLIKSTLEKYKDTEDMVGALMILDTDSFKHINDTYGHSTGDRVLAKIGEIIRNNFKGMDVTGCIGFKELYDKADKALYNVKTNGKASHRIYDESLA